MTPEEIILEMNWTFDSDPGRFQLWEQLIKPAMIRFASLNRQGWTRVEDRQGCRWTKASERLPEKDGNYYCRFSTSGILVMKEIVKFSDKVFWDNAFIIVEQYMMEEIEWLDESPSPTGDRDCEELKKIVGSIERNANKINEHTWKVYKEQILDHCEQLLNKHP